MGFFRDLFGSPSQSPSSSRVTTPNRQIKAPVSAAPTKPRLKVVDVPAPQPGGRDRAVSGTQHFEKNLATLPIGPVKVTLRHKPNKDNPFAIAAYVGSKQIGWLSTEWSATDAQVQWIRELERNGLRPRFAGQCRDRSSPLDRIVNFTMPKDSEFGTILTDLTSKK